jgi:nitroreductase
MDFFNVLDKRRSVRKFKSKPVEKENLLKILEAANSAPSAGNLQAYRIVVVEDETAKEELAQASLGQDFISRAPVVLVFLADRKSSSRRYGERGELYSLQDATISASYAQLAATALGLGSVWIGAFDEEKVKQILNKEELKPVAIIPIGYPDEKPGKTPRRSLDEIAETV